MRHPALLLLVAALGCGGAPAAGPPPGAAGPGGTAASPGEVSTPALYRLQLAEGRGDAVAMTLWLSPSDVPVRADLPDVVGREARRARIGDVRCEPAGAPVARGPEGWLLPAGCDALRYRVAVDEVPDAGVDPGALLAVRSSARGWWFLPGAALLLVPQSLTERPALDLRAPDGVEVFHRLATTSLGLALPPRSQLGRVMIGLGHFIARTTSDGHTRFHHLFDAPVDVDLPRLSLATSWLASLTGGDAPRDILVFWFGRDPSEEPPPGAAGLDAVTACYYRAEVPEDADPTARFAPLVSLLEQHFALLTGGRLPDWARDSLGRLYAIRALWRAGLIDDEGYATWMHRSTPGLPIETKLLSMPATDASSRAARMRVGVGFFNALQLRLAGVEEGGGLDGLLGALLGLVYRRDGTPPRRLLTLLIDAGADDAGEITSAWLGWPAD